MILGRDFILIRHEGRARHDLQLVAFDDPERHVGYSCSVSTTTERSGSVRERGKISDSAASAERAGR